MLYLGYKKNLVFNYKENWGGGGAAIKGILFSV